MTSPVENISTKQDTFGTFQLHNCLDIDENKVKDVRQ